MSRKVIIHSQENYLYNDACSIEMGGIENETHLIIVVLMSWIILFWDLNYEFDFCVDFQHSVWAPDPCPKVSALRFPCSSVLPSGAKAEEG